MATCAPLNVVTAAVFRIGGAPVAGFRRVIVSSACAVAYTDYDAYMVELSGVQTLYDSTTLPLPAAPNQPVNGVKTFQAAAAISGQKAGAINAAGQLVLADCRMAWPGSPLVGVTMGAAVAGADVLVCHDGVVESAGWGLTPLLPVYLGESGALVQSLPGSAVYTQIVGYALSGSAMVVSLQPAIFKS